MRKIVLSSCKERVYNANEMSSGKKLLGNASDKKKKIQELEGRLNFLVNQASAVITIIDKKGIILYQSPSIKHILGYDNSKRIGKNFLHSKIVYPGDVAIKERL